MAQAAPTPWRITNGLSLRVLRDIFAGNAIQIGTVAIAALALGGGTSTTRLTTATADKNFLGFWTESTATSGDSRGAYFRHYFSGAGGSGEALRAYGTVNNVQAAVGGTVNGAHISLSLTGASAAISGAANALRATLDFASTPTVVGGTCAVIQVDSNIAAGPTIPAATAFLRFTNSGAQVLSYLMNLPTTGSGLMMAPHTTQVMTDSIRIVMANGSVRYLMCTTDATNRTGGA